jgi:hypothetical protein
MEEYRQNADAPFEEEKTPVLFHAIEDNVNQSSNG